VSCDDLGARWLAAERLMEARTLDAAVRTLAQMLLERSSIVRAPEPRIAFAMRALWSSETPSIDELASRIGWSRQHQNRAFSTHVGIGPKQFARIARLQRALRSIEEQPDVDLARAACELGYFDQAHMARDFRQLAGIAPSIARAGSIFPIRPPEALP
jgi:AraC-like DNA-binding protein